MQLEFRGVAEDRPGQEWAGIFARGWPGWRKWFRARRDGDGPRLDDSYRALRRYMPEMEQLWERLVETVGGDDEVAQFLSFWRPPRYLVNCSQIVLDNEGDPVLIRNYDLDPDLNESTLLNSAWRGRRVMGMVEGMAGLADGVNEAGLAASLTFGGRVQTGRGFGIPLIMRYMLELGRDVQDAREVLRAVPCHMSYNVTVADRAGEALTVMLSPDRPLMFAPRPYATNHQLGVEWPRHGRLSRTRERAHALGEMMGERRSFASMRRAFLEKPLFSTGYDRGFGTVYTAAYRPAAGEATLAWREGEPVTWNIHDFHARRLTVSYSDTGSVAGQAHEIAPAPSARGPLPRVPPPGHRSLHERFAGPATSAGQAAHQ